MPHFVIDCSHDVLNYYDKDVISEQVFMVANASSLFKSEEIKVRLQVFSDYSVGNKKQPFVHVFSSIMEGRSIAQRASLSKAVVSKLADMFPQIENIAINISEFNKATYCNRAML